MVVDKKLDPNATTFTPLEQEVHSNIKYIGMGYMPCNGYVPCQPVHLEPDKQQAGWRTEIFGTFQDNLTLIVRVISMLLELMEAYFIRTL